MDNDVIKTLTTSINSTLVGEATLSCNEPNGWSFVLSAYKESDDVEILTVSAYAATPLQPPRFEFSFSIAQNDINHYWAPSRTDTSLPPMWGASQQSAIAQYLPLHLLINANEKNRLAIACNEALRPVYFRVGIHEETCTASCRFVFFDDAEAPLTEYSLKIRLDRREIFYGDAVSEAVAWIAATSGAIPCEAPDAAFDPLYSTWYCFHQNVFDKEIEEECAIAASIGMKTLIVDDGWQTDDTSRGYAFCGDWKISPRRFPDMASHVRRIQKMGFKYMLWYSVPFVGEKSENYERFKGKFLFTRDGLSASILDPRFPEVREFIASTYEKAALEWGLDGFKLDFIDNFTLPYGKEDPAVKDNWAGRDIKTIQEAVDVLMLDVAKRLKAIRPDMLIEFRQAYIGTSIRKYGNMMRASDCPGDFTENRKRTASLRMTSGQSAVHADMLEWHPSESAICAARSVINVIFSVIQYSMMLRNLPEEHLKMMRHWIAFTKEHKDALLKGSFKAHHPELKYPWLEGESATERVIGVYSDTIVIDAGSPDKTVYIVNGTGTDKVCARLEATPKSAAAFDTFGVEAPCDLSSLHAGPVDITIPPSGYIRLTF